VSHRGNDADGSCFLEPNRQETSILEAKNARGGQNGNIQAGARTGSLRSHRVGAQFSKRERSQCPVTGQELFVGNGVRLLDDRRGHHAARKLHLDGPLLRVDARDTKAEHQRHHCDVFHTLLLRLLK